MISAKTKINLIIGDPIEHSLSPLIHNQGYQVLGIQDEYVYLAARVKIADLASVLMGFSQAGINGITCTAPHKVYSVNYLAEIDKTAKTIGAVNTIVNNNGKLKGYNTDWLGIQTPLINLLGNLQGKKLALIGAGGAARASAYMARTQGMELKIFNRTMEKAKALAKEFAGQAFCLDDVREIKNCDIVINATKVGMADLEGKSPISKNALRPGMIVFDNIYIPVETKLIADARAIGCTIIYGYEMLLHQATAQFELYTGQTAPIEVMEKTLKSALHII